MLQSLPVEDDLELDSITGGGSDVDIKFTLDCGPRIRYSITIDPAGNLLAEDQTLLGPVDGIDARPPAQIQWATYTPSGFTASG